MDGGESGFGLDPWFKKSPGAIFHERSEPAGQGAGKRRVNLVPHSFAVTDAACACE